MKSSTITAKKTDSALVLWMGDGCLDANLMRRLNLYLYYLEALPGSVSTVHPKRMAESLLLDPQLVRRDMKSLLGKARVYEEGRDAMLAEIRKHTGRQSVQSVVLVGVGKLGSALMSYAGFSVFGLDILVGFDTNGQVIRRGAYGKPVYHVDQLEEVCRRLRARVGIITTPGGCAQDACDALIAAGAVAIWNFTAVRLKAPPQVMVYSEDMSASLRRLAEHAALF